MLRLALAILLLASAATALNPIVFSPGYSLTKLHVKVVGATIDGCPADAEYDVRHSSCFVVDPSRREIFPNLPVNVFGA